MIATPFSTLVQQVPRHAAAHHAEPDKTDPWCRGHLRDPPVAIEPKFDSDG
jgi:hypothetical protein